MSHDYHEMLPGYSSEQVLHDGCGECENRAEARDHGIGNLDSANFARAWRRAAEWNRGGLRDIAVAEVPMLQALWSVQVQLERRGIPIGAVPHSTVVDFA